MSTNSIFRAISCQHFRLLTIVWHLDDNQGPQFDKRLQQMFNFAEGRWLLWYIFFQFIYFMVGFDRIIWLVSSHMNLMGWRSGNTRHNFVSQIFFCTSSSQISWMILRDARNVSLSKEKCLSEKCFFVKREMANKHPCNGMLHQATPPCQENKNLRICQFDENMGRPLLLHSTLLPSPRPPIFHIISDACQGQKCIHALHLSIKHPHHSQPWMWKMWFVLLTNQMWWSKRSPVKLEHGPIKNRCSVLHI